MSKENHAEQPIVPAMVSLAGAGPGDPELLTLKTLSRIKNAGAIVYDALVSGEIQALFPPSAELFPAGKRAGDPLSSTQASIHGLLERLARSGLAVLRLKGGDPFIFGRGGEEALYLMERGIPFEVLPGVSSVNGAAAAALVPLTHRGVSHAFTVLQGTRALLDRIDWPALAALGGTWVFLMAGRTAGEIAQRLIAAGAERELPMVAVENATLERQTLTRNTLGGFAGRHFVPLGGGPVLLLAGPTAGLGLSPFTMDAGHAGTLPGIYEALRQDGADRRWR
ncbi:MAG: uroporphyrinogen-III C-methyltransferase [bacterium]